MLVQTRYILLSITALFATAGFTRASDGRIPISGTTTLVLPGHYYLTTNIASSVAGGIGINIQSSNVVLDLNGHTITMTGTGSTRGIYLYNVNSVVIRNGSITGAANALQMTPAVGGQMSGIRMERLALTAGAGSAILAFGGGGSLSNLVVEYCQFFTNAQRSVDMNNVQGLRVEGNEIRTVNSTTSSAIYVHISASVELINNRISGGGNGIDLVNVTGARVTGNSVTGADVGISIGGSNGNFVLQNVCTGNGAGIDLNTNGTGSLYNAIEGNLLGGNNFYGLIIRAGSTGNAYGRNRALNNGATGTSNYLITGTNRSAGDNCDQTICTN